MKMQYKELINDTISKTTYYTKSETEKNDIEKSKIFNTLILNGKLNEATTYITSQTKNVILNPTDIDEKTNKPVLEVLQSKNPEIKINNINEEQFKLEEYDEIPTPLKLQITESNVTEITSSLHGAGGPTGFDAITLKNFPLCHVKASKHVREEMANWAEYLAN